MKKFIALVTVVSFFFQAVPAMAWVGGPYSNNTTDGFSGGIFQGMISMKNGSGLFKFSTGSESTVSPNASSVVFHQGLVFYGDCWGLVDFHSKKISGITNGQSSLGTGDAGAAAGTTDGLPSIPFGNGNDSFVCNTQWSGKITKSVPVPLFRAKGFAYIFDATYSNTITTDVVTDGIIEELPGDPAPIRQTTITQTITQSESAPKQKIRIRVRGSRVSFIPDTITLTPAVTPAPAPAA